MKKLDQYEKQIFSAHEHGELKSVVTSWLRFVDLEIRTRYSYQEPTCNIRLSLLDLADI